VATIDGVICSGRTCDKSPAAIRPVLFPPITLRGLAIVPNIPARKFTLNSAGAFLLFLGNIVTYVAGAATWHEFAACCEKMMPDNPPHQSYLNISINHMLPAAW
jgi:hypothetical protein